MEADSNISFHQGMLPPSMYNCHVVSFQSGAASSSSMMFPMDSSGGLNCTAGMLLAASPGAMGNSAPMIQSVSPSGNLLLEPVPALKHDTGLAADWAYDEQLLLEEALLKYSEEPNMMRYIKIAALLPDKTVRDVALRCRWMTKKENGKRRKPEEFSIGKKMKDRKDKLLDSSFRGNVSSGQPPNMGAYPFMMPLMDHNNRFSSEVPVIDGATRRRLDENTLLFSQIAVNLETLKLQDNIGLLSHTRNNITAILNSMMKMPGIMSQMPPLPIGLHDELADSILRAPCTNQLPLLIDQWGFEISSGQPFPAMLIISSARVHFIEDVVFVFLKQIMYGAAPASSQLKQEPRF